MGGCLQHPVFISRLNESSLPVRPDRCQPVKSSAGRVYLSTSIFNIIINNDNKQPQSRSRVDGDYGRLLTTCPARIGQELHA
jgi:hypothetical protein